MNKIKLIEGVLILIFATSCADLIEIPFEDDDPRYRPNYPLESCYSLTNDVRDTNFLKIIRISENRYVYQRCNDYRDVADTQRGDIENFCGPYEFEEAFPAFERNHPEEMTRECI